MVRVAGAGAGAARGGGRGGGRGEGGTVTLVEGADVAVFVAAGLEEREKETRETVSQKRAQHWIAINIRQVGALRRTRHATCAVPRHSVGKCEGNGQNQAQVKNTLRQLVPETLANE